MRFEKPPVLIAPAGGEEKMQTYLAPNKILAIKKTATKCVCVLRFGFVLLWDSCPLYRSQQMLTFT